MYSGVTSKQEGFRFFYVCPCVFGFYPQVKKHTEQYHLNVPLVKCLRSFQVTPSYCGARIPLWPWSSLHSPITLLWLMKVTIRLSDHSLRLQTYNHHSPVFNPKMTSPTIIPIIPPFSPSRSSRIVSGWQQRVKDRQEMLVVTICETQSCRQDIVIVRQLTSNMDIPFEFLLKQIHIFIIVLVKVGTCFAQTYRHPPVHNLWVEQHVCSQRMRGHADGFSSPVLFDGSMLVHAVRVVLVELLPLN